MIITNKGLFSKGKQEGSLLKRPTVSVFCRAHKIYNKKQFQNDTVLNRTKSR